MTSILLLLAITVGLTNCLDVDVEGEAVVKMWTEDPKDSPPQELLERVPIAEKTEDEGKMQMCTDSNRCPMSPCYQTSRRWSRVCVLVRDYVPISTSNCRRPCSGVHGVLRTYCYWFPRTTIHPCFNMLGYPILPALAEADVRQNP